MGQGNRRGAAAFGRARARISRPGTEARVLLGLSLLLAVVVLANDWGILTPDTKPEFFLAPWRTARDFARPWLDSPELGAPSFNVGVAPVAAVLGLLDVLGLPPWLLQRLWRIGLLLLAAGGARALYDEVTRGSADRTAAGRVAAAVAFAANPYVIAAGTTPTLLPYALLPWFVLALLRGVRGRGWRWPAVAALVLAATSGLNAGVVTILQLIVVLPIAAHVAVTARERLGRLVVVLVQTGGLFVLLSLYWLIPSVFALTRGSVVVASTESLQAINIGASYAEALRGLGIWPLYGSGAQGPFLPGQIGYLTLPLVVVLTFGGPVLAVWGARLSRSAARVLAAGCVATGALVMAAPFPFAGRSAWGDLVVAVLDGVPGAGAFRTLNKAGAVLELGLALLIGLAAASLLPRLTGIRQRATGVLVAGAVLAGSVAPALTGGLFPVTLDLPGYWRAAAARANALGAAQHPGRVLLAPGIKLADYDWGYAGPDDLGNSLLRRPNAFRTTTPSGAPEAAALLAEVDHRLYLGALPAGSMSALLRLISAGVLVSRYDTAPASGAKALAEAQLAADPGLGAATGFGGTGGELADVVVRPAPAPGGGPAGIRAVVPGAAPVLVDSAGDALPDLVAAGLLPSQGTLLVSGALADAPLAAALGDGAHLVLTDANRRRTRSDDPTRGGGALLPAGTGTDLTALYGSAEQTVATTEGTATVTTTGPPQVFGPFPQGDPSLAFDADPTTAWLFGNFRTGVGTALTVRLEQPRAVGQLVLRGIDTAGARLAEVRVTATGPDGPFAATATLSEWASFPTAVDLGDRRVDRLTIEATSITGPGDGWVGLSEIAIPGVRLVKVARSPIGLVNRVAGRDVSTNPLSVLLHRRGGDRAGLGAEEPRLERDFTLPDRRRFVLGGTVRLAGGIPDDHVDALLGADPRTRATSSARAFGNPALRAAAAFDDAGGGPDLGTGWIPEAPVAGQWVALDFPRQRLREFTIVQNAMGAHVTTAQVSVDDGEPIPIELTPGSNRVVLPREVSAQRVRLLITGWRGTGFVRILDIGLPRVAYGPAPTECLTVGTVDGAPLRVQPSGSRQDLAAGRPVSFAACDGTSLVLDRGGHRVRSVPDFAVDDLRLRSPGTRVAAPPAAPEYTVTHADPTRISVRLDADCDPCYLSSGQGLDARWRGSLGERDLGAPTAVDGYASGWRIEGRAGDVLTATYAAAGPSRLAWLASLGGALVALLLVWGGRGGQGDRGGRGGRGGQGARGGGPGRGGPGGREYAAPASTATAGSASPATAAAVDTGAHPRRLRVWAVVAGAVLAAALSVGIVPALLVAALAGIQLLGFPRRPVLLDAAVAAVCLLPIAWYAGPRGVAGTLAEHVTVNVLAHQLAGLVLWLVLLGVALGVPARRHGRD